MPLISLFFSFQENSMVIMPAYVRVDTVFLLPLLDGSILSHIIVKNMVILITFISILSDIQPIPDRDQGWVVLIARECVTGLILAMILSLLFWIASAIGEIIDNQSGATISVSIDSVNALQSTTMLSFLSFSFGAIFMAQGWMVLLMNQLVHSYRVFPLRLLLAGGALEPGWQTVAPLIKEQPDTCCAAADYVDVIENHSRRVFPLLPAAKPLFLVVIAEEFHRLHALYDVWFRRDVGALDALVYAYAILPIHSLSRGEIIMSKKTEKPTEKQRRESAQKKRPIIQS